MHSFKSKRGGCPRYSYEERVSNLFTHYHRTKVDTLKKIIEQEIAEIEAMTCGLPCIGSDDSGIREQISHMHTGYLCEPTSLGLRKAIHSCLANQELAVCLGAHAKKFAVSTYSLNRISALETKILLQI